MVNVIYTHNYYVYTYRGGEGATSRGLFLGWRARVPSTLRARCGPLVCGRSAQGSAGNGLTRKRIRAEKNLNYFVIIPVPVRYIYEQHGNMAEMHNNIIDLTEYRNAILADLAKEDLIDRVCEEHNGSAEQKRSIRGYLRAELSEDPDFWHGFRKAYHANKEYLQQERVEQELVELLRGLSWSGIHALLDQVRDDPELTARVMFLMGEYDIDPDQYE